jgi:hypothetical protein
VKGYCEGRYKDPEQDATVKDSLEREATVEDSLKSNDSCHVETIVRLVHTS